MTKIVVRAAAATDAEAIYRAWEALRQYYASIDSRIIPAEVSAGEFEADFLRRLARRDLAAFVAIDSGSLIGFITGGVEANQPDRLPDVHVAVGHLFVEPGARRRGIGRMLFGALSEWATQQGGSASHFEMPVLAIDVEAMKFWQAVGFSPFIQRLWAPLPDQR